MHNELMKLGLPKWPQMYTTGKPVTFEQAQEIIRRTDTFFTRLSCGNNHKYNERVAKKLGVPLWDLVFRKNWGREEWAAWENKCQAFHARWETIETEYVRNQWISSAYIDGPHGWCHPNGQIGFIDNVGKWPSVEEIYNEWKTLAAAFPFLEIDVTLMNDEECVPGKVPVVRMRIRDANVELVDAATQLHTEHQPARRGNAFDSLDEDDALKARMTFHDAEQGIPMAWIDMWAKTFGAGEP